MPIMTNLYSKYTICSESFCHVSEMSGTP